MASIIDDDSLSDLLTSAEVTRCQLSPEGDFPAPSPLEHSTFNIKIISVFARRSATEEEPGTLKIFSTTFPLLLYELLELPVAAREAVASRLRDVNVLPQLGFPTVLSRILECSGQMALGVPSHGRVLELSAHIYIRVDELPDDGNDDNGEEEGDEEELILGFSDGDDQFDYAGIRFVPASEAAIEGLERLRISGEDSEKQCVVCLEDISVGSEATRLPCLHYFHGDCIVKWLNTSKCCPLCCFELAS